MNDTHMRAAILLADLRLRANGSVPPIHDLEPEIRPAGLAAAYDVQRQLAALLEERGHGRPAGWKIGCTSKTMQEHVGIDHPCAGRMFDSQLMRHRASYEHGQYNRLGLECEIAVELNRDLLPGDDPTAAIEAVMTSIEVVEERFADYRTTAKESLVADDFFHLGCVLGRRHKVSGLADLGTLKGGFSVNGAEMIDVGAGSAIQGHPYKALMWLAHHLEERGGVRAGEVVTLGSVIRTIYPSPGDHVRAEFDDLGSASVEIC